MTKKIGTSFSLVFMVLCALLFSGCGQVTLSSLVLDVTNVRTILNYDENLDCSQMIITGKMSNGSLVKYEVSDVQLDLGTFNKSVPGKYTITVKVDNVKQVFDVVVKNPTIVSMSIDVENVKQEFEYDEEFNYYGLKVFALYADGTIKETTSFSIDCSNFQKNVSGNKVISVKLNNTNYSAQYVVHVKEQTFATGIALDASAVKTEYKFNENLDVSNLQVNKIMDYGGLKPAKNNEIEIDDSLFNNTTAGTYSIKVKLKNTTFEESYNVTVVAPELTGIDIVTTSVKKNYKLGESFTSDNLEVFKTFTYGENVKVNVEEFNVISTAFDNTTPGVYEIQVYLNNSSFVQTFEVQVLPDVIENLTLNTTNVQKEYGHNESLNLSNLIVTTKMEYGGNITLPEGEYIVNASEFNSSVAGVYNIYISVDDVIESFSVSVNWCVEITLNLTSVQTEYGQFETFNAEGLIVQKNMANGEILNCSTAEYTIDKSAFKMSVAGEYVIKAVLNEDENIFKTYNVFVNWVAGLQLDTTNTQTEFDISFQTFNYDNLIVKKEMADGTLVVATASEYSVDSSAFDVGNKTIIVKYVPDETIYTYYSIHVDNCYSIFVSHQPNKTKYAQNESFDSTGMVVEVYYQDKGTMVLNAEEYIIDDSAMSSLVAGEYYVKVKLKYNTSVYTNVGVSVDWLEGLSVDTTNAKLSFNKSENFSTGTILVKKVYASGEKYLLSNEDYYVDSSNYEANNAGQYDIKVVYIPNNEIFTTYQVAVDWAIDISINTTNAYKQFGVGEEFTYYGLVVKKYMASGLTCDAGSDEYIVDYSNFNNVDAGTYSISVNLLGEFIANYNVEVVNKVYISSLVLDVTSVKTSYAWGESITYENLTAKILKSDNSEQNVTNEISVDVSNFNACSCGTYTIYVNYEHVQASYNVTVAEITNEQIASFLEFDYIVATFENASTTTINYADIVGNNIVVNGDELFGVVKIDVYLHSNNTFSETIFNNGENELRVYYGGNEYAFNFTIKLSGHGERVYNVNYFGNI